MSLKKIFDKRYSLAFRLSILYSMIFTISFLVAFFIFYFIMESAVKKNEDQALLNELKEFTELSTMKGDVGVETEIGVEARSDGEEKVFFKLVDLNGNEIFSSDMSSWGDVGIARAALKQLEDGADHVFETLSILGHDYDVRIIYGYIAQGKILQIGHSLEDDIRYLRTFRNLFSMIMIVFLVFSIIAGWFMARRALVGVKEVTQAALDISNGAFERRVQVRTKATEIEELAKVFNRMLDQITTLIKSVREVTDNIAHDLKTPITRLRGIAESHLNSGGTRGVLIDFAGDTVEECDYLLQMINTMLDISEIEAGTRKFNKNKIDMAEVIQKAVELFLPLAAEKGVTIIVKAPATAVIYGVRNSLDRMIVNLLENAIKYTPSGGTVTISFNSDDKNRAVISVQDTGIGISNDDIPHIFKRLFRCDTSRSLPGFGLGLALVMAIARAHGGNIIVSSQIGKGSTFKVILPQ